MAQLWSVQDRTRIQKGLKDLSFQNAPLLRKIKEKGRVKKNQRIKNQEIPLKLNKGTRPDRSYGRGTIVQGSETVESEKFTFTNGRVYYSETVYMLDEEENPKDKDQLLEMEKEARKDLMEGASEKLATLMRTGTGLADFEGVGRLPIGLNTWLPTSLGTIGGLSQTANPEVAHGLINAATDGPNNDPDTDLYWCFREGIERATRRTATKTYKPDLILTTATIVNYMRVAADTANLHQFRNQGQNLQIVKGTTEDSVIVDGIECIIDDECPAGRIDILSSDSWCLEYAGSDLFTVRDVPVPGALLGDINVTARANISFFTDDPARNTVIHNCNVSY